LIGTGNLSNEASMKLSQGRILTTHTGSLPRPPELVRLYTERLRGRTDLDEEIEAVGTEAVGAVVARQIETGIDVINNGEQQRESFVLYLRRRLSGMGGEGERSGPADVDDYPVFKARRREETAGRVAVTNADFLPKAIGEVRYLDQAAVEKECSDFAAALKGRDGRYVEGFYTAPSPGLLASIVKNEHYDTFESYLAALGAALKVEYDTIARHGFVLQLDCPDLALERHTSFRDKPIGAFLEFVEMVVDTINRAIADIPRERIRAHVCWGNYEGPHDRDVALTKILPIVQHLDVGALVLPFGNARHAHEYHCLGQFPLADDQAIVAGVIDTLSNVVEHPETIAERLVRVAEVVGDPARVLAGTDCGFDTSAGNGRVAPDIVWGKLAALRDGARLASERLFGR
jgi:5-methyltetrahydropteroyltriglutamate--homocysteine methyltransferase